MQNVFLRTNGLKKAKQYLSKLNIIPFEGATDGHALYYEASMMQAIEDYKKEASKRLCNTSTPPGNGPITWV